MRGAARELLVSRIAWSKFRGEDFDGVVRGLDLPWTEEWLRQIDGGEADPDRLELRQWRVARCRRDTGEAWVAWVTPAAEGSPSGYSFARRS
jgi:hypothetical protein